MESRGWKRARGEGWRNLHGAAPLYKWNACSWHAPTGSMSYRPLAIGFSLRGWLCPTLAAAAASVLAGGFVLAQPFDGPPPDRPGGPGGRFDEFRAGFRGGPPMPSQRVTLVEQFDKDADKRLNAEERKAAREFLAREIQAGRGPRRPGFRSGPADDERAVFSGAGPKLSPKEVKSFPDAALYDVSVLRTLFLQFEDADWEQELAEFYHTDVEVPATLTVDGKVYRDVGVHFRGASSFFTVGPGRKRSLNLSLDFVHHEQDLGGYHTLNLLNSHTDPTYLRSMLFYHITRDYIPAPKANYVRLVINGESWGIYVNVQQFNKEFVRDWFQTTAGARWKVPGSPRARGGLEYLGEDVSAYKTHYELKTKNDAHAWTALIQLCRVLHETPSNKLEAALSPLLDVDGTLKFLALENALINDDGYWIRSSDYSLYRDPQGRFHVFPQDANETFRLPEGPGRRNSAEAGIRLDPLTGAEDPAKPLLHKLLAVPALRARYLAYVRAIAERWLEWKKIEGLATTWQELIAADVKADPHKLGPYEAFAGGLTEDVVDVGPRPRGPGGGFGPPGSERRGPRGGPPRTISLKRFVEERRAYLLSDAMGK
jgi:hypothetical protein